MPTLRPLIRDQELDIDDHRWGTGQPAEWGGGYHIHKRFLRGRRKGLEIRIPIDRNREIEVSPKEDPRARKVMHELQEALEETESRRRFAEDLAQAFDSISMSRGRVTVIRRAARRVARHFGLTSRIVDEAAEFYRNSLYRYRATLRDPIDKAFHAIVLRGNRISISAEIHRYDPYPWYTKYFG